MLRQFLGRCSGAGTNNNNGLLRFFKVVFVIYNGTQGKDQESISKDIFLEGFKSGLFNLDDFLIISEGTKELSLEDFTNTGQQELVGGNLLEVRFIILGENPEGDVVRKRWLASGDVVFPLDVF